LFWELTQLTSCGGPSGLSSLLRDKLNPELIEVERDILRQPIFTTATAHCQASQ